MYLQYLYGLGQCVEAVGSHNLPDLVFASFTDLKTVPADSGFVKPDTYAVLSVLMSIFITLIII
jgi:hypothetical protein